MTLLRYFANTLSIIILLISINVGAQKLEVYKHLPSEVVVIPSKILKEDHAIFIHCPKIHSTNKNKQFQALYLLDWESHFDMLSQYTD